MVCQDEAIEAQIKALADEKLEVREKATAELMKAPLAKLPLLDGHLAKSDGETRERIRSAMTQVLIANFGTRKGRFELRAFAPLDVMKTWCDQGADPKSPPSGYEAVIVEKAELKFDSEYEPFNRKWILVEPVCITHPDVLNAEPRQVLRGNDSRHVWAVDFRLSESASKRFDAIAGLLFNRKPKGILGIFLNGNLVSAPVVNAEKFGGRGVIDGTFDRQQAEELAAVVRGSLLESWARIERESEKAAELETLRENLRGQKGLSRAVIKKDATGLEITGIVDIKELDLLALWRSLRAQGYRLVPKK